MRQPLVYERVLVKLSGETIGGRGSGIDPKKVALVVSEIRSLTRLGVPVAIVVGGGNWWRKRDGDRHISGVTSDYLGMLGTVLNALALRDYFKQAGWPVSLQSYLVTAPGIKPTNAMAAKKALKQGQVVIFAGGTGKPLVTTDTAAAQRAREIKADAIFKVGLIDGVYTANPDTHVRARKFKQLTFSEAIRRRLKIMDFKAYQICRLAKIPVLVFKWRKGCLKQVMFGGRMGTIIVP